MRCYRLYGPLPVESRPLRLETAVDPSPGVGEIAIRLTAASVGLTDVAVVEGALPVSRFPVVPGGAAAGVVEAVGLGAERYPPGARVAFSRWRASCDECAACRDGLEHLCRKRREHGRDRDGAFAEIAAVPETAAVEIPASVPDAVAAALAGDALLGFRAVLRPEARNAARIGLLGYGDSGHVAHLLARSRGAEVSVYTRSEPHRLVALTLGAAWAGTLEDSPEDAEPLDAILSFGFAGRVVPAALRRLRPGGGLIFAASLVPDPLPAIDFERHLSGERTISGVSSAPLRDLEALLACAAREGIAPATEVYEFEGLPEALDAVKGSRTRGAAVLSAPRR